MAKIGSGEFRTVAPKAGFTEEIEKTVCDMCGRDIVEPPSGTVEEVTVELRTGWSSYGDYDTESQEYDICADCFTNRLVPFIKEGVPEGEG